MGCTWMHSLFFWPGICASGLPGRAGWHTASTVKATRILQAKQLHDIFSMTERSCCLPLIVCSHREFRGMLSTSTAYSGPFAVHQDPIWAAGAPQPEDISTSAPGRADTALVSRAESVKARPLQAGRRPPSPRPTAQAQLPPRRVLTYPRRSPSPRACLIACMQSPTGRNAKIVLCYVLAFDRPTLEEEYQRQHGQQRAAYDMIRVGVGWVWGRGKRHSLPPLGQGCHASETRSRRRQTQGTACVGLTTQASVASLEPRAHHDNQGPRAQPHPCMQAGLRAAAWTGFAARALAAGRASVACALLMLLAGMAMGGGPLALLLANPAAFLRSGPAGRGGPLQGGRAKQNICSTQGGSARTKGSLSRTRCRHGHRAVCHPRPIAGGALPGSAPSTLRMPPPSPPSIPSCTAPTPRTTPSQRRRWRSCRRWLWRAVQPGCCGTARHCSCC